MNNKELMAGRAFISHAFSPTFVSDYHSERRREFKMEKTEGWTGNYVAYLKCRPCSIPFIWQYRLSAIIVRLFSVSIFP